MQHLLSSSNPDDDSRDVGASSEGAQPQSGPRRSGRKKTFTVDDMLEKLDKLGTAVCVGVVTTQVATVMQRSYNKILDTQLRRQSSQAVHASPDALAALVRQNPSILEIMEPFLDDSTIELILRLSQDANA